MPRAACSSSRSDENGGTSLAESSARKGPSPDSWYRSAPILVRSDTPTRKSDSSSARALRPLRALVRSLCAEECMRPIGRGPRGSENTPNKGLPRFEVLSSFKVEDRDRSWSAG